MSFSSVTTFDGERKPRTLPARELDPVEIRVLGSLMEKQLSTPEYYPLTLNALAAAANQKSNREPVMDLGDSDLQRALDRLQDEKLVWKVFGGRAVRYDHNLDSMWQIDRAVKAILTLLFLRGPQTAGEIRGRSERLHAFESVAEAEEALQRLATLAPPVVRELPRRPGQKESRWAHLLGGAIVEPAEGGETSHDAREPLSVRVQRLEEQLAALTAEFHSLRAKLGE
ncbi:MAG: uncharacterized protein QOI24_4458 [Acidobacteriota bacterium]|jgi:uncharacterized protein YceH (UPF0502 family)|nr:uncharacterized protein [Acidobacteriota bacterium]